MAATIAGSSPTSAQGFAVPIGSVPRAVNTTARRAYLSAAGEVMFGGEEGISLALQLRELSLSEGQKVRFWRLEAKVESAQRTPSVGDQLVVTEAPYENAWFSVATFKRGKKSAKDERTRFASAALSDALREIEQCKNDPWESGNFLTAAVSPPPAVMRAGPLRSYGGAAHWVIGVCTDFEALAAQLWAADLTVKLLEDAAARRLHVVRPSSSPRGRSTMPVHPEACDAASATMWLSIRQALAGPHDAETHLRMAPPVDSWVGMPVVVLVERLFRTHLYNQTRNHLRREAREAHYFEE